MDYTREQITLMLQGAYKKLKSYYYYDKTLLFIKKKIADFEADDSLFGQTFNQIATALLLGDTTYFDSLIEQVDFKVFPKSLISVSKPTEAIVGTIDHQKNISKVNFFIDAPIELLILDCLWTICIAKIGNSKYGNRACSYAGRFKSSIFLFGKTSLHEGIDWESNRCFEPYYENYSRWQKDAFTKLRQGLKDQNQLMFSLDLKSFYYSVRFDFKSLGSLLSNDSRLDQLSFITSVQEKLYLSYTKAISKYKIGIDIKDNATIFPIGLLSPIVLRELYLYSFDRKIEKALSPIHYGRYVDDMLFVIPTGVESNKITPEYVCNLLSEKGLIKRKNAHKNEDYFFVGFETIAIQLSKINCFFFEKNASNILIEVAEKQIRSNSSEANLLPEFDTIMGHFNDIAYFFNSIGGSTKIRDIGILQSNHYAASKSVTLMKQLLKNTHIDAKDKRKIDSYINDLLEFYRGSAAIEFMGSWTSVFELILQVKVLSNDKKARDPYAQRFYRDILNYIDKELSFDCLDDKEIYSNKKKTVFNRMKASLRERVRISISMAMALDYSWKTSALPQLKNIELAKSFRKSNMFNHNLVSFPLLNYLPFDKISTCSFLEIQKEPWNDSEAFKLDQQRLFWTPRFIHLDELFIYSFMQSTQLGKADSSRVRKNPPEDVWDRYITLNHVDRFATTSVAEQTIEDVMDSRIDLVNISIPNRSPYPSKHYIGLANTAVSESDALQSLLHPEHKMSINDKERLFRMANTAVKEKATFITFPEFFVPVVWLKDLTRFAQKNNVAIVAGLRYIRNSSRAFNYTVLIQPCNTNGYQNAVALFREKNFYAPEEKDCLYKLGYHISNPPRPMYYVVNSSGIRYSSILCFEFTDIYSRSSLKSKIDALFVPQLNKDTNYFSSIVESASRDLYCFIVQANTSKYGDSRITGPYDTIHKNVVQIKGGINDVIIVGELNLKMVKESRRQYEKNRKKVLIHCYKCKKLRKAKCPDFFNACKNCKYNSPKQITKDVPAFFE